MLKLIGTSLSSLLRFFRHLHLPAQANCFQFRFKAPNLHHFPHFYWARASSRASFCYRRTYTFLSSIWCCEKYLISVFLWCKYGVQISLKLSGLKWTHKDQLLHQVRISKIQQYLPSSKLGPVKMDRRVEISTKYSCTTAKWTWETFGFSIFSSSVSLLFCFLFCLIIGVVVDAWTITGIYFFPLWLFLLNTM